MGVSRDGSGPNGGWRLALRRTLLGVAAGVLLGLAYSFLSRTLGST